MEALDSRGQTVSIGAFVRYNGTGTVGQVSDLKEENNNSWAKFDDGELWYSVDTIEVIKKEDLKHYDNDDNEDEKIKNLKDNVKDDAVANFTDVDACGAG